MTLRQFIWTLLASLAIIGILFLLLFLSGFWNQPEIAGTPNKNFLVESGAPVTAGAADSSAIKAQLPLSSPAFSPVPTFPL